MALGGVYQIVNKINDKRYIGSSINLNRRRSNHFSNLRKDKSVHPHLQAAWNLYGEDAFEFGHILICEEFELLRYEQALLDKWKPEYNSNPVVGSGYKHSPSPEVRERYSLMFKGKKRPKETGAKISSSKKGVVFTAEHKRSLSVARQSQSRRDFCKRGHPYNGPTADVYLWRDKRICRLCRKIREERKVEGQ